MYLHYFLESYFWSRDVQICHYSRNVWILIVFMCIKNTNWKPQNNWELILSFPISNCFEYENFVGKSNHVLMRSLVVFRRKYISLVCKSILKRGKFIAYVSCLSWLSDALAAHWNFLSYHFTYHGKYT